MQPDQAAEIGTYGIWYASNELVKSRKGLKQAQLDILACGMPKITELWFLFYKMRQRQNHQGMIEHGRRRYCRSPDRAGDKLQEQGV
jgi:hypothetical protein